MTKLRAMLILSFVAIVAGCNQKANSNRPEQVETEKVDELDVVDSIAESAPTERLDEYVSFPSAGVKIRRPRGFDQSPNFDGFEAFGISASVRVMSMQAPFKSTVSELEGGALDEQGLVLVSKSSLQVEGSSAVLMHCAQQINNERVSKLSLVFGDDNETYLVTATIPENASEELVSLMKSTLLSTKIERSASAHSSKLSYSVKPVTLKETPGVNNALMYTRDGATPLKSPADPLFVVSRSFGRGTITDRRTFAERRIHETATIEELRILTNEQLEIAGMEAHETTAEATHSKTGVEVVIYQAIVFDGDSYVLMQGRVGKEMSEDYLPEFKEMARSFQKDAP